MRIAIVSDAWEPQVNGVVRTLQAVRAELERMGHQVIVIAPDRFATLLVAVAYSPVLRSVEPAGIPA